MLRLVALVYFFAVLVACGQVDHKQVTRGKFEGAVTLVWLKGNTNSPLGDGLFLYLPEEGNELSFTRTDGPWVSEGSKVITPAAFYTDGGSVPRAFHALNGFNAWAYGPAYVVHDWVFVARKCLTDFEQDPSIAEKFLPETVEEIRNVRNMSFKESAYLMGETIKTVVGDNLAKVDQSYIISKATAGPVSHALWKEKGGCLKNFPPEQGDEKEVEDVALMRQAAEQTMFKMRSRFPSQRGALLEETLLNNGNVVTVLSYSF